MPRVPQVTSPSVKSDALPGVSIRTGAVTADAFGARQGEFAQRASRVADVVTDNMVKAKEQRDVADAMDATDKLFSEAQAKQQELSKRMGKDADGVQEEMAKWHEEKRNELGSGLSDRSRKLFDRKAQQLALRDDGWANDHYTRQMDNYYDVKLQADVENAHTAALYDPKPETISQSIATAHENFRDMAHRKGYDDAWVASQTQEFQSKLHGGILQNAIDQDAVGSVQSYLEQNGDKLDPGLRGKAEKWVHNKQIDETAGAYADSLIAGGVSYSDALADAREKFSGDDEDKYVRKIKELYGEREHQKNLYVKDQVDAFEKLAYQQGVDKLTDEQLDHLAQYDAGIAARWKQSRDEALEVKAAGGSFAKDSKPDAVAELNARLTSDGSDKITKPEQIAQYKPFLSESDYKAMEKRLDQNRTVKEDDVKQAYMIFAPKSLKEKQSKEWTVDDWNNYNAFAKMAAQSVKDTANPDYVGKLAAEWWLKGEAKGTGYTIGGKEFLADETTKGQAFVSGLGDKFAPTEEIPRNTITDPGLREDERQKQRAEIQQWLDANPNDPRAAKIRERAGL